MRVVIIRTAVVRVNVDPTGVLAPSAYESGVDEMRLRGLEVVHTPAEHLPDRDREVELIVEESGPDQRPALVELCRGIFGTDCSLGVVTYISRGTDEDARGILAGFDLEGSVAREGRGEHEIVQVTVRKADMRRVPESRLHTAMQSALNCEVEILTV